jgi:hypothetical protein
MNYFATKITDGEVIIAGVLFKKNVEVEVDHALYCYLNGDKRNFRTDQKRIINAAPAVKVEEKDKGGPIEKVDLKGSVKPDKTDK